MTRRIAKKIWLAGCVGRPHKHNRTLDAWSNVVDWLEPEPKWHPSERHIEKESARVWRKWNRQRERLRTP